MLSTRRRGLLFVSRPLGSRVRSIAAGGFAVPAALIGVSLVGGAVASLQPGRDAPETPRQPGDLQALAKKDHADIRAAVADLYAVISGPAGPRDWDAFRALFAEGGRLAAMAPTREGGMRQVQMTPEEYIERSGPFMQSRGFFETEIAREIEVYGSIAHVFSSYETRFEADGEVFQRGINSISLVRTDAGEWKVYQILWQGETDDNPLPERFEKRGR